MNEADVRSRYKKTGCDAAGFPFRWSWMRGSERFGSAGRLAATRLRDLLPQTFDADRADHDLLTDHIARRAVHAHRFGEFEVFFDGGLGLGAGHVLLELGHVESEVLGRGQRPGLVRLATTAEQFLVEV